MDEGDPASAGTAARHLVDQAIARGPAGGEGGIQIRHPIAQVMDAGTATLEEPGDRAVRRERREQLDLGVAERQGHDGGAVRLFRRVRCEAEDIPIKGKRRVEIRHGDSDMRNAGAIRQTIPPANLLRQDQLQENNIMATTNPQSVHVTDSSFAAEIEQANGLVLVDFWATWCGPCQAVAPILEQLAGEYVGKAKVTKVDVDANQRTAMRFNVRSIPSILFFKNGQHVDTVIGAVPKATLEGKIKQHLA